ncbi:hypothetical protein GPECTOR_83g267 [Gonium pectorale]|uniref:Uncharacterized protein n=1 Tax=Gonium pectorale TaxID=33097 RepID=A0A150G2C1_GONPE|nr:hypothetical protein GPECTOR_83g267 [Gonium pectorale]|eukprot:KXZ43655.1 hypothetical protein GPECTOR_83g267 [Gonium pectorale]
MSVALAAILAEKSSPGCVFEPRSMPLPLSAGLLLAIHQAGLGQRGNLRNLIIASAAASAARAEIDADTHSAVALVAAPQLGPEVEAQPAPSPAVASPALARLVVRCLLRADCFQPCLMERLVAIGTRHADGSPLGFVVRLSEAESHRPVLPPLAPLFLTDRIVLAARYGQAAWDLEILALTNKGSPSTAMLVVILKRERDWLVSQAWGGLKQAGLELRQANGGADSSSGSAAKDGGSALELTEGEGPASHLLLSSKRAAEQIGKLQGMKGIELQLHAQLISPLQDVLQQRLTERVPPPLSEPELRALVQRGSADVTPEQRDMHARPFLGDSHSQRAAHAFRMLRSALVEALQQAVTAAYVPQRGEAGSASASSAASASASTTAEASFASLRRSFQLLVPALRALRAEVQPPPLSAKAAVAQLFTSAARSVDGARALTAALQHAPAALAAGALTPDAAAELAEDLLLTHRAWARHLVMTAARDRVRIEPVAQEQPEQRRLSWHQKREQEQKRAQEFERQRNRALEFERALGRWGELPWRNPDFMRGLTDLDEALSQLARAAARHLLRPLRDDELLAQLQSRPGLLGLDGEALPTREVLRDERTWAGAGSRTATPGEAASLRAESRAPPPVSAAADLGSGGGGGGAAAAAAAAAATSDALQAAHADSALWRTPALPLDLPLAPSGPLSSGRLWPAGHSGPAAAPRQRAGWTLDPGQQEINMRLAEMLQARTATPDLALAVLQLYHRHSRAIALPTQAALVLCLRRGAQAASPAQLGAMLGLLDRMRLYPAHVLHAAAARLLALHARGGGDRDGCGNGAPDAASPGAAEAGAGAGSEPTETPPAAAAAQGAASPVPAAALASLVRCLARTSPFAELDGALVRSSVEAAAAAMLQAQQQAREPAGAPAPAGGQGGLATEEGAVSIRARSHRGPQALPPDQAAALKRLVGDVQALCDRLRPAHRNAALAAIAPLRALAAQNADQALQALFVGVLEAVPHPGGRPSLPQLQLLVAHLPQMTSTPGLSRLVDRLLTAHEAYLAGELREPGLPAWRAADQLLRAAAASVFTVRLELLQGLQERVLLLPSPELMQLAAQCGCLHLLPPPTLAAIANRLRAFYGVAPRLHAGGQELGDPLGDEDELHDWASGANPTGSDGILGAAAMLPRRSAQQRVGDEAAPPASVALMGLAEAVRRRLLVRPGPGPDGDFAAPPAHGSLSVLEAAERRRTSDSPAMCLGVAHSLATVLAAEAAVTLTAAARSTAEDLACELMQRALAAPPVRPTAASASAATASPEQRATTLPLGPTELLQLLQAAAAQYRRRSSSAAYGSDGGAALLQQLLSRVMLQQRPSGGPWAGGAPLPTPSGSAAGADNTADREHPDPDRERRPHPPLQPQQGGERLSWLLQVARALLVRQPERSSWTEGAAVAAYTHQQQQQQQQQPPPQHQPQQQQQHAAGPLASARTTAQPIAALEAERALQQLQLMSDDVQELLMQLGGDPIHGSGLGLGLGSAEDYDSEADFQAGPDGVKRAAPQTAAPGWGQGGSWLGAGTAAGIPAGRYSDSDQRRGAAGPAAAAALGVPNGALQPPSDDARPDLRSLGAPRLGLAGGAMELFAAAADDGLDLGDGARPRGGAAAAAVAANAAVRRGLLASAHHLYDHVRPLLDELEVELAEEVGSGILAPCRRDAHDGDCGARRRQLLLDASEVLSLLGQTPEAVPDRAARGSDPWVVLSPSIADAAQAGELDPEDRLLLLERMAAAGFRGDTGLADLLFEGLAASLLQLSDLSAVAAASATNPQRTKASLHPERSPAVAGHSPLVGVPAEQSSSAVAAPPSALDSASAVELYQRASAAMAQLGRGDHPMVRPLAAAFAPLLDQRSLGGLLAEARRLAQARSRTAAADGDAAAGEDGAAEATAAAMSAVSAEVLRLLRRANTATRAAALESMAAAGAADGAFVEAAADMLLFDGKALGPELLVRTLNALATATTTAASASAAHGPNAAQLLRAMSARLKALTPDFSTVQLAAALAAAVRLAAAGLPGDRALPSVLRRAIGSRLRDPGCGAAEVAAMLRELAQRSIQHGPRPRQQGHNGAGNKSPTAAAAAAPSVPSRVALAQDVVGTWAGIGGAEAGLLDDAADALLRMAASRDDGAGSVCCGGNVAAEVWLEALASLGRLGYPASRSERWAALLAATLSELRRRAATEAEAMAAAARRGPRGGGLGCEGLALWPRALDVLMGLDELPPDLLVMAGGLMAEALQDEADGMAADVWVATDGMAELEGL